MSSENFYITYFFPRVAKTCRRPTEGGSDPPVILTARSDYSKAPHPREGPRSGGKSPQRYHCRHPGIRRGEIFLVAEVLVNEMGYFGPGFASQQSVLSTLGVALHSGLQPTSLERPPPAPRRPRPRIGRPSRCGIPQRRPAPAAGPGRCPASPVPPAFPRGPWRGWPPWGP